MAALLPVTALAEGEGEDIVVSSGSAMQQWQQRTTAELNRALMREPPGATTENAIIQITFTLGEDGKAANPQFFNRDGSFLERSMAKRAIMSLDNLAEVPVADREDARFLASIIFANDPRSYTKLQARLRKMEQARIASRDDRRQYLALGY
ncbi:MAG: hypothetical protein NBV60_09725 [Erythrobacter sp.]|nr:hypothetical protein [Erythrobacter sp.]